MSQDIWNITLDFTSGYLDCKAVTPKGEVVSISLKNTEDPELPIIAAQEVTACSSKNDFPAIKMKLNLKRYLENPKRELQNPLIFVITKRHDFTISNKVKFVDDASILIIELNENIDEEGNIIKKLSESEINKALRKIYEKPTGEVVVALANSMQNPIHEKNLFNLLIAAGYKKVYLSHEPYKLFNIIPKVNSIFFDTFLAPSINKYLESISQELGEKSVVELSIL